MTFDQHCSECIEQLGDPFNQVHHWLDEFSGMPLYGSRHRRARHHEAGIAEATALWGEKAGKAARLHIISDLRLEGWENGDPFPRDEIDFIKIGLW